MGQLDGKVAVITGGASGIGEATVRLFTREGARVVIADLQDEKGKDLAGGLGASATYLHADVSREPDVEALIQCALEEFGSLDCMFNNAGIGGVGGPIDMIPVDGFDMTIAVDLRGVFLGMKHAAAVMKRQGSGCIISTASLAGIQAVHSHHIYAAAKAAVIHLTRSVAMELGESGIRANCICPGWIATPILGRGAGLSAEDSEKVLESVKSVLANFQPIRRAGLPEDVARAALWLASDESSFVNGHALVVDGGIAGGKMWTDFFTETAPLATAMGL